MLTVPYAVYARGTVIHHTAIKIRSVNRPVDIGGITVEPGEVLHAGKEGVIKIPPGCLEALPERAADMRMIEHLSHIGNRRDDLNAHEERDRTMGLFKKYGFI